VPPDPLPPVDISQDFVPSDFLGSQADSTDASSTTTPAVSRSSSTLTLSVAMPQIKPDPYLAQFEPKVVPTELLEAPTAKSTPKPSRKRKRKSLRDLSDESDEDQDDEDFKSAAAPPAKRRQISSPNPQPLAAEKPSTPSIASVTPPSPVSSAYLQNHGVEILAADQFIGGLFLGNHGVARNHYWLVSNEITFIVNATSELRNFFPDQFRYEKYELPMPHLLWIAPDLLLLGLA